MTSTASGGHWRAVIDIGSNSVRLVIYDVAGRAMLPHFNEKVMARLGAGLGESGYLSPEGIEIALKALRRFKAILDGLNVTRVRAVATAAVRLAKDGPDFAKQVEREIGLKVDVITGDMEARLSALGVSGGMHQATGLVGDLGGSSLEFARLEDGVVKEGETLMLGPLSMDMERLDGKGLQKAVRAALGQSKLLPKHGGQFFMVGGAWRALAKLHMNITDYPLRQLNAYELNEHALLTIDQATKRKDPVGLEQLSKASSRRFNVLPYANLVLQEVFAAGKFKQTVVSAYGLREGVILEGITNEAGGSEQADPLLDGAALCVRLQDQRREFGEALYQWVAPVMEPNPDLFGERGLDMRLVAAACLLADAGTRFHPHRRAELAYGQALNGPYSNVTHAERSFIALSVGCRYSRNFRAPEQTDSLLDKRQKRLARRLGAAMQLGSVYSGRSAEALLKSQLKLEGHQITLMIKASQQDMVSGSVERRLRVLANLLDLDANIQIG